MNTNLGNGAVASVIMTLVPSHDTSLRIRTSFDVRQVVRVDGSMETKLVIRDAPHIDMEAGTVTARSAEVVAKTLRDAEVVVESMLEPGLIYKE